MTRYKVVYKSSISKDLRLIPEIDRDRIIVRVEALAINPRPPGCEKLTTQSRYRIRQGDYRIIYEIHDDKLIVWIIKIAHRRDVYKVSEEKEKYNSRNFKGK